MKFRLLFFFLIGWVIHIFAGTAFEIASDTGFAIYLQSIPTVLPPEIQKNKIKYTINFVFDTCSEDQWVYYNSSTQQLIVDFYGIHIVESPQIVLKGLPMVKSVEVKNFKTQMSLSGLRSQIILTLDSFWSYESVVISGNVLRLQLWKILDPAEVLKKDKNKVVVSLLVTLISTVTASLTVLFLILVNNPN